jgi:hypothetical protein
MVHLREAADFAIIDTIALEVVEGSPEPRPHDPGGIAQKIEQYAGGAVGRQKEPEELLAVGGPSDRRPVCGRRSRGKLPPHPFAVGQRAIADRLDQ